MTLPIQANDAVECTFINRQLPKPEWTVSKTASPGTGTTVAPGTVITYMLRAQNTGTLDIEGAKGHDDLSKVLKHATLEHLDEGLAVSGDQLSWTIPTLKPGEETTVKYTVKVNDTFTDYQTGSTSKPESITNTLFATGPTEPNDCTEANPCETVHTPPEISPPLTPGSATPGDSLSKTGLSSWLIAATLLAAVTGGASVLVSRLRRR